MYKAKRLLAIFTAALMLIALLPALTVSAELTYSDYEFSSSDRTLTAYLGSGRYVAIPEKIDGVNVSTIGDYAFSGSDVEYVAIPQYVTKIGDYAFADCYGLQRIYIPSSVKTFGEGAFDNCDSLIIYAPSNSTAYTYALNQGINRRAGSASTVTVTLNPSSGSVTPTSLKATVNFEYGELPVPTRSGYKFDGWYTSSSAGEEVTWDTIVEKTSNHTIYAHWTRSNEPTITTDAVKNLTSSSVTLSGTVTSSAGTYTVGFDFEDLTSGTSNSFTWGEFRVTSSDRTFNGNLGSSSITPGNRYRYRAWAENSYGRGYGNWVTFTAKTSSTTTTYTVTFDSNGGSTLPSSERTKKLAYGEPYGELPVPTRNGYKFLGWFTGKTDSSEKVTSDTVMNRTTSHTLYAHWMKEGQSVTVNFSVNGGNTLSSSDRSKTVVSGEPYGYLPTPTRSNYDFAGWYTAASGGSLVTEYTLVENTSSHTLYAHWSASSYPRVTTDPYSGSTLYGTLSSAGSSKVTKFGFEIINTSTGGLLTGYASGSTFTAGKSYTLSLNGGSPQVVYMYRAFAVNSYGTGYGEWLPFSLDGSDSVTVTFNVNGGSSLPSNQSSKSVTMGEVYGELPTPTRGNYNFVGWYTSATAGTLVTEYTKVETAANHSLYAHWSPSTTAPKVTTDPCSGNIIYGTLSSIGSSRVTRFGFEVLNTSTGLVQTGYADASTFTAGNSYSLRLDGASTSVVYLYRAFAINSYGTGYGEWQTFDPGNNATYTVTFDVNGGKDLPADQRTRTVRKNQAYGELPVPSRDDYIFEGWYTDRTGGVMVSASTVFSASSDQILYARWKKADTPKYTANVSVGTVNAYPGGTVTVPISITQNPGLAAFHLNIGFDKSRLTPADIELGSDLTEGSLTSNIQQGGDMSRFDYVSALWTNTTNFTGAGVVVNVTFTVAKDAPQGSTAITVTTPTGGNVNQDREYVGLNITNGAVNIANRMPGDVDRSGNVDTKDILTLVQYLASAIDKSAIDPSASDVNGDARVDLRDGVRLSQYLAGWEVNLLGETATDITEAELQAGGSVNFSVGSAEAKAGGYVDVPVEITENSGLASFSVQMDFDSSKLTPVSISLSDNIRGGTFSSNIHAGGDLSRFDCVTAVWLNSANNQYTGPAFTVRFKVNRGISGEIPVTISYGDLGATDQTETPLNVTSSAGRITVNGEEDFSDDAYTVDSLEINHDTGAVVPGSGTFYAEAKITKNSDRQGADTLVIAVYKGDKMMDMTYMKADLTQGQTVTLGGRLNADEEGCTLKAFVWDSLSGMLPLSNVLTR